MPPTSNRVIPPGGVPDDPEAPMTAEQAAILRNLAEKAGEPFDGALSRHQAEERIAYLKERLR